MTPATNLPSRNGSTISFEATDDLASAAFYTHGGNKEANRIYARRIVACVRACSGIETEELEQDGFVGHMARQAFITNMQAAQGQGFGLALEGGACRILVESFVGQFKGAGAINSLEVGFDHPETGPMTVTMQRAQGKTPAQQRSEAEALRDELLAALEAAVECGMVPKTSAREGGALSYGQAPRVADTIRDVIAKARKAKGLCYYAPDGTLMSPDGTRSIFDDVDA